VFFPSFQRYLTARRQRYAFVLGSAMWMSWLVSVVAGPGRFDLAGHPIGADFLQFYAAGETVRRGFSSRLYELPFQWELQRQIIGPELTQVYAFITPPHLAWLYVPLSALPYELSYALWCLVGLACLVCAMSLLDAVGKRPVLWSLTSYVVFASISYGQNSLLSLMILSLTYWCWRRGYSSATGLVLSLVMYKPQLALGVAILWLLDRDWRGLLSLALGTSLIVIASLVWLPEASVAYLAFARTVLADLPHWHEFPLWNLHTVRGFWQLLLPTTPTLADVLTISCALAGLAGFVMIWRRFRRQKRLLFAFSICLTWWLTPHAMIYDLAILLIPGALLWLDRPSWRASLVAVFGFAWLATLLSPLFTLFQQKLMPFALQISVPVLVYSMIWLWRRLQAIPVVETQDALQESTLPGGGAS